MCIPCDSKTAEKVRVRELAKQAQKAAESPGTHFWGAVQSEGGKVTMQWLEEIRKTHRVETVGRCTLIHGDCADVMAKMPDKAFELCVCDPPYGGNDAIGMKDCKAEGKQATQRTDYRLFENVQPPQEYFDELKMVSCKQIIWGVNFYTATGLDGGRICWDKKGTAFGRAELAYYSHSKSVEVFEHAWNGMIQADMKNKEYRIHPTQKPVKLYQWLLDNYAKQGDRILDTHLGSGSIAIACNRLGFDFVGIELDADYFEAALKRIKQEYKQQDMFAPQSEQIKAEQSSLL